MKRYLLSIILCVLAAFALSAQEQDSPKVPMTVSISEASSNVPASSWDFLTTRLNAAITKNGMGATDNFTQFFLSCTYSVVDKHIVPGSPTKYFQTVEMNYFVDIQNMRRNHWRRCLIQLEVQLEQLAIFD